MSSTSRRDETGAGGRIVLGIAALVAVAVAAFSVGQVSGARHRDHAGTAATVPAGIAGLSVGQLQSLESQVEHAKALAQGSSDGGSNDNGGLGTDLSDLSGLEQQLGISPSASAQSQADQLQAELNAINACLSGASGSSSAC